MIKNKNNRKFKEKEFYSQNGQEKYFLLPFRFHRLNENKEIIVNEIGDFLIIPNGASEKIITKTLNSHTDKELYEDLLANFFITEERVPPLLDIIATRYRTKKSFLDNFTALHIFVISLRCEHTCHYCQVSRVSHDKKTFDMKQLHIDKGIELMMRSPNKNVTMEFQGGEALLAFENIVYAVERTSLEATKNNKNVTYVICTNLALLTDEILDYCKDKNILISASLDGPDFIHNKNRHREINDFTFQIGDLETNTYEEIFYGEKAIQFSEACTNESLPGCSECAFQNYCGADPVFNHTTQGDIFGYRPTSSFCQKNMEIIRYLFELMESDKRIENIFQNWTN